MFDGFWSRAQIIDDKVMSWCTQFAHWFQRLTGRTSFFIAKIGVGICLWSLFVSIANYWYPLLHTKTSIFGAIFQASIVFGYLSDSIQLNKAEESLLQGRVVLPAWIMSERISASLGHRMLGLLATLVFFGGVLGEVKHEYSWQIAFQQFMYFSFGPGIAIFSYFVNVNPLPPGTSKFRKLIESLSFGPKTVRVEN